MLPLCAPQTHLYNMTNKLRGDIPEDTGKPLMTEENFTIIFPYNIIFDSNMVIHTVGATLRKFNPNVAVGKKMTDIIEMEYPKAPFDFNVFLDYININFVLQSLNEDGSHGLRLKGKATMFFLCLRWETNSRSDEWEREKNI